MEALATDLLTTLADGEIDALIEIMLLAAYADGSLDYAEIATLKKSLRSVDETWLSHIDLEKRITDAKRRIDTETREIRLAKLRPLLPWPEQRLLALKLAIRIVAADGIVHPSERELVLQVAESLGIRDELAADLVGKMTSS
jgi:uncharacterized tellurite resistance protein B-like protein